MALDLTIDQLNSKSFWQEFAEGDFSIDREDEHFEAEPVVPGQAVLDEVSKKLKLEGYVHIRDELSIDFTKYIKIIKKMYDADLPPVFAYVYDELWQLQSKMKFIAESYLGEGCKLIPTPWIWHVDPTKEKEILQEDDRELATRSMYSGFYGPHRDKGRKGLNPDGSPKILSFWLPLTEANPLNSCIYIVPANRDPTYATDKEESWLFKRADIRALPAEPGDILFWNEAVVHWGSRPAPGRDLPARVSMGLEYISKDCLKRCTHYDIDYLPDFQTRLDIIAVQFKLYLTYEGFPGLFVEFMKANPTLIREGKEDFS